MNIEWRDWCRLCASSSGSDVNIFEKEDLQLTDKIVKYLSISVDSQDDMPKSVCQSCSQRLVTFDHYAEQCLRVQAMFGAMLEEGDENDTKVGLIREEFLQEIDGKNKDEEPTDNKRSIEMLEVDADSSDTHENIISLIKKPKVKLGPKKSTKQKNKSQNKKIRGNTTASISSKQKVEGECEIRCSSRLQEIAFNQRITAVNDVEVKVEIQEGGGDESNNDDKVESGKTEEDCCVQSVSRKRGRPGKTLVGAAKRKAKVPRVVKRKTDGSASGKEDTASDAAECDNTKDECNSSDNEEKKDGDKEKPEKESNVAPSIFKWECHVCGEVCRNWYCLSIHCRQLHKVPAQVVCLCAKVLASRTSIIKHRLKHTNAYKYRCDKCDKAFHRKALLDLHTMSHIPKEEQPFVCCKCARRFHSEALLRQHERVHLPKEERLIYPCTICTKKFSSKAAVSYHLKAVHSGERPYVCDQCGHSFTSKGILQEHLTIHSDETPFKCAQCKKSFKTKYRLKIHMDTHRETPYQCPICPLQLSTRRTLRMHLVVHRDTKAYQCATCGKAFRRAKDLKNHHNLHTGRRPYTCTFCPRTFANGSNCRAHKRKMHPEELRIYEASLAAAENEGGGGAIVPQVSTTTSSPSVNKLVTEHQQIISTSNLSSSSPTLQNPPQHTATSDSNELESSSNSLLEKHSIFGSNIPSGSLIKKTSLQIYPSTTEHSHLNHKYLNSTSLGISENSGTIDEHILPHSVSESNLMTTMSMSRMSNNTLSCRNPDQPRGIQNLSLASDLLSDNRNMSAINLNVSRRNMTSESVLDSGHMAALAPLNLNVSEMHSNRHQHHISESSTMSEMEESNYMSDVRRGIDTFVNSRHHIPNLNSNIQIHRQQQHQNLTLSRSLVEREMAVPSNLNRMHHSQHSAGNSVETISGLQGYTSLNHLYQHHGESMPSAVAAAIAHSGSMGVPAFPGNPYIHHNMGYTRGSSNM